MNKIDFLTDIQTWFTKKFGSEPEQQAKKVAEAHIESYISETFGTGWSTAMNSLFKNHFHLSNAVVELQNVASDLKTKIESLLPKSGLKRPDIGAEDVE